MDVLLKNGLSLESRHEGMTALHYAIFLREPELVRYFLGKGASINDRVEYDGSRYNGFNAIDLDNYIQKKCKENSPSMCNAEIINVLKAQSNQAI